MGHAVLLSALMLRAFPSCVVSDGLWKSRYYHHAFFRCGSQVVNAYCIATTVTHMLQMPWHCSSVMLLPVTPIAKLRASAIVACGVECMLIQAAKLC